MKTELYTKPFKAAKNMILASALMLIGSYAFSQNSTLTLISPNGGESYLWGTTVEVSWENTGTPGDLVLEITEDGGNYWYYLDFIFESDTSGSAIVQLTGNPTNLAKLRISYYNDPTINDESDGYFTIVESPVFVSTPSYGSSYYKNQPVYVSWYSYTLTTFDLDYSLDNGSTWTNIVTGFTGFNYTWTAPDQVSSEALIRIADASDPSGYGLSPLFSITEPPTLQVSSPNGGETWNYGQNAMVSWTGTNLSAYVNIEFSYDGGTNWSSLGYGYSGPEGGSAEVSVPYISTENALVRIMDYNYYYELDRSDATFNVEVPPVIVYYPYGGEQYYNNQQMYFSWIAAQDISALNFELSTDNGQTWQSVAENIPSGQGYFYWTVNGTPSESCIIKIADANDPARFGLSGIFTILGTPVITLNSPIGGEILNTGEACTISWSYDNPGSTYIYLEYSNDNGQTWYYINYAMITGPEGSYEWTTPEIESDQYKIRIMDYYLGFVADTSEAFTVITFPETPICMVTVDSATNRNIIVWEKPVSDLIDQFVVYKESNEANVYEILGMVDYESEAVITDTNSNPNVKSYRYKLGFADAGGHYFPAGDFHQTIHLTINKGVGNSWNLIWTGYAGFDVTSYNIYRKSGTGNYEQISSISASFDSYTDISAPEGTVFYMVEVLNPNGCNPSGRSGEYSSSWSNVATNSVLAVNDPDQEVKVAAYPNPAHERLYVSSGEDLEGQVKIILSDLLGHTVYSDEVANMKRSAVYSINTADFKEGIYMLKVSSENGSFTRKVVVKH